MPRLCARHSHHHFNLSLSFVDSFRTQSTTAAIPRHHGLSRSRCSRLGCSSCRRWVLRCLAAFPPARTRLQGPAIRARLRPGWNLALEQVCRRHHRHSLKQLAIDTSSISYPGARVDTPAPTYQLTDKETWHTWEWKQLFPGRGLPLSQSSRDRNTNQQQTSSATTSAISNECGISARTFRTTRKSLRWNGMPILQGGSMRLTMVNLAALPGRSCFVLAS